MSDVKSKKPPANSLVSSLLKSHFSGVPLHEVVTASQVFPGSAPVDLKVTLDRLFGTKGVAKKQVGIA